VNTSEQVRLGTLLIAEIARLPARYWPDDAYAFGRVLRRLQPYNGVANKFWVSDGPMGPTCLDFREIRSMMHSATLISYNSQHDDRFYIEISPRGVGHLLRRINATPQESEEAKALLLAHWQETYGQPWKKPTDE
jgi:hypothetical protein